MSSAIPGRTLQSVLMLKCTLSKRQIYFMLSGWFASRKRKLSRGLRHNSKAQKGWPWLRRLHASLKSGAYTLLSSPRGHSGHPEHTVCLTNRIAHVDQTPADYLYLLWMYHYTIHAEEIYLFVSLMGVFLTFSRPYHYDVELSLLYPQVPIYNEAVIASRHTASRR